MCAEAMEFPRQNADLETMELCWSRRTHPDFKTKRYITSWKRGISYGGGTIKDAGRGQQTISPTTWIPAALGTAFSATVGPIVALNGRRWRRDRPMFDASLKEFTTLHEAQPREVKDDEDPTWGVTPKEHRQVLSCRRRPAQQMLTACIDTFSIQFLRNLSRYSVS